MSAPLPALTLQARDGTRRPLTAGPRPTLVHFWATWCPPCRAELPGLLALPDDHPIDVVAIALDEDWPAVERFFDGQPPPTVFLTDPTRATAAFALRTLPVTYLVAPDGHLRLRYDGPRDWTAAGVTAGIGANGVANGVVPH